MTPTTYGRDFAYCLKSHGGVRGFYASLWRFLLRRTLFCHSVATFLTSVSSYEGGCGFEDIVLTHLYHTTFEKLSIAYSNYFLTYNATLFRILKAIADISVHSFNHHNIFNFSRSYKAFLYITFIWFGDKLEEVNKYSKDVSIRKSIKKQREWTTSINSSIKNVGRIIHLMTTEFNNDIWHYFMALQKQRIEKQVSKHFVKKKKKAG